MWREEGTNVQNGISVNADEGSVKQKKLVVLVNVGVNSNLILYLYKRLNFLI